MPDRQAIYLHKAWFHRFASVYKEFRDVSEFMHEISNLEKPKPEPGPSPAE